MAQEQQKAAERSLREYGVSTEAERAAEERATELENEIKVLRRELEIEQAAREKFEAVAKPPKKKFSEHGHYSIEVDLLGLEIIASLGVSPAVLQSSSSSLRISLV